MKTNRWMSTILFCVRITMLLSLVFSQFGAALRPAYAASGDIGIVLPSQDGRWLQDEARFKAAIPGVEVLFSNNDSATEYTNVKLMVDGGIQVLIICPVDSVAAGDAVEYARLHDVKVIAYDRLVMDTEAVDFYVTFDSVEVGEAQAQYLVDHAVGTGNPLYLYAGSETDNNAFLFFEGAWSVLQPFIYNGTFVIENSSEAVALQDQLILTHEQQAGIFTEISIDYWDPNNARELAEDNLAAIGAEKGDVFILAPNDGTARAIADVFDADPLVTSYVITGQDAERASVQYIIDGKQSMTVLKDIRILADDAADAAETFLIPGTPASTTTYFNGLIDVPADPTAVVTVDQANVTAALIDSDYYDACDFIGLGSYVCLWYSYEPGSAEETALLQVIEDAEAAISGLDIRATNHSFDTIYSDYETAVSEGRGPDMLFVPNDNLGNEARAGQLLNLDSYLTGNLDDVNQAAIDGMKYGGVLYGVPESASVVALYYNKSLVPTPPTTTAELLTLLNADATLAAGVPGGAYFLYGFWNAFGGQLMDGTGKCIADQGGFEDAMQYLLDLQTAGASFTDYNDAQTAFQNGDIGMLVDGPWVLPEMLDALGSNLGVVVLPEGPSDLASPLTGINGFFVNPNSQHPGDAVDAALFMTNQASSQIFTDTGGHIPVRSDVTTNSLIDTFSLAATQGEPRPQNAQFYNYWGPFDQMTQDVLNGLVNPTDGIRAACWQMNRDSGFPSPYMQVRENTDEVEALGWPMDAELTLSIDNPATPELPDYISIPTPVTQTTPWGSGETYLYFNLRGVINIQSGFEVSINDGTTTKTHTVTTLAFDDMDMEADTVSGVAAAGSRVDAWACDNTNCYNRHMTASDPGGTWVADWSKWGPQDDEHNTLNLGPGTWVDSSQGDYDGDSTMFGENFPNPNLNVFVTQDRIEAREWPEGHVVTLTIGDPEDPDYTDTLTMGPAPWNPDEIAVAFDLQGIYHYQVGDLITVSDGTLTKTHTVMNVNVTGIVADTISGTSDAGADIRVEIHQGNAPYRTDTADGSGNWSVDFSVPQDDQGTYELTPGLNGSAKRYDEDGDASRADWHISNPFVEASTGGNWVHARDWPETTVMKLEIDDLSNGLGGVDYTTTATVVHNPENPGDPNDIRADFGMGSFILAAGDVVSVSENTSPLITKVLTVSGLVVDDFDVVANTVGGNATAGADVEVGVCVPGNCISRTTTATGGTWTVDFDPDHDLQPGDNGWAAEYDSDSDRTWYDWRIPNPNINASPKNDWVQAEEWPLGAVVNLTINSTLIDTKTMVESEWGQTVAQFNLHGYDVKFGDIIIVADTGGVKSKSLTVSALKVTGFDIGDDTVSGEASHGVEVEVCVNWCSASRYVMADSETGMWMADFTADHDLQPGDFGWAQEFDPDGDVTHYDWDIPNPNVQVRANDDRVEGQQWPLGDTVTITVNGGHPHSAIVTGDSNQTYFESSYGGEVDIKAGDIVTVTNGLVTKTTIVSVLSYTDVDMATNIVSGIAGAGAFVELWICDGSNCNYRKSATANGSGYWSTDFTGTYDIVPGTWIDSSENESGPGADGDSTMYGVTIQETYTVSGTLGANGANATVTFTGGSTTANSSGDYFFPADLSWTGTITPSKTGYTFSPTSITVSAPLFSNLPNQNFTAIINTYTLTYTAGAHGSITGASPQTVNYGASGATVTAVAATGYHFVNWSDGILTASRTDTSVSHNISVTANFAINTYTVSGSVGATGARVTFSGTTSGSATISGSNYSFTVPYGWTGTVTPSKAGYVFSPVSRRYTNITANQSAQNYTVGTGPGVYDNTHANWVYTGAWTAYTGSGPYNNTMRYTTAVGNAASFTFSGTQFIFTYYQNTNRGKIDVYVDGNKLTTINANGAAQWQKKYTSPVFPAGMHVVQFRHAGGGTYIDVDAIQILATAAPGVGVYDNTHANWVYTGAWTAYTGSGPYNNTWHYTSTVGNAASFTFSGTQFIFTYYQNTNRGKIDVYVDGNKVTTITATGAGQWQKKYTSPVFPAGTHVVQFKHAGGGTYIDVDAIQILATAAPGVGVYDNTHANWVYTGAWTAYTGSGPYNNTMRYTTAVGNAASFTFSGKQFIFTYYQNTNRGKIDVYVDGNKVTTITATGAGQWQKKYTSPIYAAGTHVVQFRHAGGGTYIDVDAIQIK